MVDGDQTLPITKTTPETREQKIQGLVSNVSSPYFFHSSDHSRLSILETQLNNNYSMWKQAMYCALIGSWMELLPFLMIAIFKNFGKDVHKNLAHSLQSCDTPRELSITSCYNTMKSEWMILI